MSYKSFYRIYTSILIAPLITVAADAQNRRDPTKIAIVYRVPGMEKVVVRPNIVFDNLTTSPLAFDAYLPRDFRRNQRRPVIIFISGAERARDWRWFVTWGQIAAAQGFVGVVPDKRYPRGLDGVRTGFEDTQKVIAFLHSQAERFGIDPQRICLWTFSAGGRLISVGLQPGSPPVKCIVSFYGVLDLSPEVVDLKDEASRNEFLQHYSPLHALDTLMTSKGKSPPIFVARAGKDSAFINTGIDRFTATALRVNAPIIIRNYAEGEHGFDGFNDTPQSREIIKAALQFVKEETATP